MEPLLPTSVLLRANLQSFFGMRGLDRASAAADDDDTAMDNGATKGAFTRRSNQRGRAEGRGHSFQSTGLIAASSSVWRTSAINALIPAASKEPTDYLLCEA